jgi:putative lipase involved disintegration of autophagic bodies
MRGDETYTDDTHICKITGLAEYTTVYYQIVSDGKTYDDFGDPFNFTTGKTFTYAPKGPMRGYVYKSDGSTPNEGTLVYMYMDYLCSKRTYERICL